jgi:hypothetical protein
MTAKEKNMQEADLASPTSCGCFGVNSGGIAPAIPTNTKKHIRSVEKLIG